jgi:protein gp37
VLEMAPSDWLYKHVGFPSNVWIGTSVEDQQRAYKRIPDLLRIPAKVRFLSCEPLLGELDLTEYLECQVSIHGQIVPCSCERIHWVIAGGESGHGARPMSPYWARALRNQCERAGVAFFFKQWGEYTPYYEAVDPDSGRLVEMEYERGMKRVGKHAAGRLLDGRTWDELPNA